MASLKQAGAAFVICCTLVAGFEGLSTTTYHDTLANGLPTVCYGETEGVKMGDHYTAQECKDMLEAKLPRYWNEIAACITVPVSDNEEAAYTSFAYNVGSHAFCGSNVRRKLNAGDHKGACDGLMAWDHASGRQVSGLTRRRAAERALCLTPDKRPIVNPDPLPKPYVCTPQQAEAGECLPLVAKHSTKPRVYNGTLTPAPAPHIVVCHGWWLWKVCK